MGAGLYRTEPAYRRELDLCCELLQPQLGLDLRQVLDPADGDLAAGSEQLTETALAQPALFVVEHALAKLWMEWGMRPEALIGHSVGEYVAACLAGIFSLEEALALVAARGRLIQDLPRGAMLSVGLSEAELLPRLGEALSLAAVNGPDRCVASGPEEAVAGLEAALKADDVSCHRLRTSHAFHSRMLEPVLEAFSAQVRRVKLAPPRIPILSNVTGTWLTGTEATDPDYWVRHLRQTVRFGNGLEELLGGRGRVLLEVGPGRTLSRLVRRHPEGSRSVLLASLPEPGEGERVGSALEALGRVWLAGGPIDGAGIYAGERRRRVPLPTYPFERRRFWLELRRDGQPSLARPAGGRRPDLADWFYIPVWKPLPSRPPAPQALCRWLILAGVAPLSERIEEGLRARGQEVIVLRAGTGPEAQETAVRSLLEAGGLPARIVDLRSTGPAGQEMSGDGSFLRLLHLAQSLARVGVTEPVELDLVSVKAQDVEAGEPVCPESAAALGLANVLSQEYPHLVCRSIDLAATDLSAGRTAEGLLSELLSGRRDRVVAWRRGRLWTQAFEPVRVEPPTGHPGLRSGGVYLITGGLGKVGLALAEHLAREVQAKLILTGRSPFPSRETWPAWLEGHGEGDPVSRKIVRLMDMERSGAEVLVLAADVADEAAMGRVAAEVRERFGVLHGALHAAGFAGDRIYRSIAETGPAEMEEHHRPKVQALSVLEKVLSGFEPDFCLLVSPLATVLGGLGLGAYAASHRYLEAFAEARSHTSSFPWLALSMDTWSQARPMADHGAPGALGAQLIELSMTPAEGTEVFRRALTLLAWPRVVVSTGDLGARMAQWLRTRPAQDEPSDATSRLHPRPVLAQPCIEPRDETERAVAGIWSGLLGIGGIGVHDSFFELGGDSLLATQLASGLRRSFLVDFPLRTVFDQPTVAGQADALAALRVEPDRGAVAMDAILLGSTRRLGSTADQLDDLEDLSEDEARLLLETESHATERGAGLD